MFQKEGKGSKVATAEEASFPEGFKGIRKELKSAFERAEKAPAVDLPSKVQEALDRPTLDVPRNSQHHALFQEAKRQGFHIKLKEEGPVDPRVLGDTAAYEVLDKRGRKVGEFRDLYWTKDPWQGSLAGILKEHASQTPQNNIPSSCDVQLKDGLSLTTLKRNHGIELKDGNQVVIRNTDGSIAAQYKIEGNVAALQFSRERDERGRTTGRILISNPNKPDQDGSVRTDSITVDQHRSVGLVQTKYTIPATDQSSRITVDPVKNPELFKLLHDAKEKGWQINYKEDGFHHTVTLHDRDGRVVHSVASDNLRGKTPELTLSWALKDLQQR